MEVVVLGTLSAILVLQLAKLHRPLQVLKYYFKNLALIASMVFTSFVCLPIICLKPCSTSNPIWLWRVFRGVTGLLDEDWEVRQQQETENETSCIIVANHQSILDIIMMGAVFQIKKFVLVAKKEVFYMWPIGLVAWLCGTIFIDRKKPAQANAMISKAFDHLKKEKTNIWFYPEGSRNKNNSTFLPFKKGAFCLAVQCQVPIQPIVLSPHYFLDEKKCIYESGKMIATILPLVSTEGLTMDDIDGLIEKTRAKMLFTYKEMYKEILADTSLDIPYNKFAQQLDFVEGDFIK